MTSEASSPTTPRGFYARRIFPRVVDIAMNTAENRRIRRAVCEPLHGEVLEIGFGSGHNLPFLPADVTRLLAVDPMQEGRALARTRLAASNVEVDFVGLDGQRIELPDGSADAALSTWTLCSIPDAVAAVREIARVLRPGGVLHFAEHGLSPDAKVERWQHRLNPVQNRIGCGCNIQRDIPALIEAGGMTVDQVETFYAKGDPKILGWTFQGRASATGRS